MKRCPSIDGAIALFLAFLTISNGLALLGGTGTGVTTPPPTVAPTHIPAVASAKVGAEGVNVYAIYSSEPAPMGIADYGVGASGPYNYTTTEFSGEVAIQSLQAKNATGDPSVGFQLNAVLPIQTANGLRVYWVQDVAQFDTSTNQAYFLDNVWNFSSYSSSMDSSAIRGAGQIGTYTGGQSFYYDWADALPISLPLPAKVTFLVSTALDSSNLPTVTFEYDTGAGLQSYDTVTFTSAKGVTHFTGFEVSGFGYTPAGNYYDSELVLTGACCGYNTVDVKSDVGMELSYWNGHNLQAVSNAYNFGSDTAEGSSNVEALWYYYFAGGKIFSKILAGPGALGKLYYQSEVGTINVQTRASDGTLYILNSTDQGASPDQYPFTKGAVNVTVYPGTYVLQLFVAGSLYDSTTESVASGQILQLASPFGDIQMTMSFAVAGGSLGFAPPTLMYTHGGTRQTVPLSSAATVYYMDPGTAWSVSGNLTSGPERWVTTQPSSGAAYSFQTIVFTFYHQYRIAASYSVSGGGAAAGPTLDGTAFGRNYAPVLAASPSNYWLDGGTPWVLSNPLPGSGSSERWQSDATLNGTVSATATLSPVYFHQYAQTLDYEVVGGGSPAPPTLTGERFGQRYTIPLGTGPTFVFLDASSGWGAPGMLAGSNSHERWTAAGTANGTAVWRGSATLNYHHQYLLNVTSGPSAGGLVSNTTGWHDSGASLRLTASASQGWKFEGWTGNGNGSYTGSSQNATVSLASPITESATFYPGLLISAGEDGTVTYAYGGAKGTVQAGTSTTVYAPAGTEISLRAEPTSLLYAFAGWTGGVGGTSSQTATVLDSPTTTAASFVLDIAVAGALLGVAAGLVAAFALLLRRKSHAHHPGRAPVTP